MPGKLTQVEAAKIMDRHEKVINAMRPPHGKCENQDAFLKRMERLGRARADFEQYVAQLTDSTGL